MNLTFLVWNKQKWVVSISSNSHLQKLKAHQEKFQETSQQWTLLSKDVKI